MSQTEASVRARRKGCVPKATVSVYQHCLMGFAVVSVSLTKGIISSLQIAASISLDCHNYNSAGIYIK